MSGIDSFSARYAIYTVTAMYSRTALHIMTVMHTMHTMNTMTGSYGIRGIRAMHAKKTEIPKDSSRGPLQAVYGRIGILVRLR